MSYNSNGKLVTKLPYSPSDKNEFNIFVRIMDNNGGVTVFDLEYAVAVYKDNNSYNYLIEQASTMNDSYLLNKINSGNLKTVAKYILSLTSLLNSNRDNIFYFKLAKFEYGNYTQVKFFLYKNKVIVTMKQTLLI